MLRECDAMVCLSIPAEFYAVGQFFDDFGQVTDEEVVESLRETQQKIVATG
jgi:putative phosphoribosyl transferase